MTLLLLGLARAIALFARGVWALAGENLKVATRLNGSCVKLTGYQSAEDIVIDAERRVAYAVSGDRRSIRSGNG